MEGKEKSAEKANLQEQKDDHEKSPGSLAQHELEESILESTGTGGSGGVLILQSPKTEPRLLPEIWDRIFQNLEEADLRSLINTTPEWGALLSPQKPKLLFSKVRKILLFVTFHHSKLIT